MCGLVGVAGRLAHKDLKVYKELLYVDYLRGTDSTGVGIITSANEGRLFKGPFSPEYLLGMKKVDDAIISSSRVLMGHNRAATRGKVNGSNAHPFFTGRIMGAHNGTLDWGCLRDLEKNYEGDTDSEQLINTIHTLEGNVADAIKLAAGAWALSIYDVSTKRISLVHNDQRPLYFAMSESKETLYWASEAHMLRWILTRNEIKFDNKIYEIPVDVIFSWEVPDSTHRFADKPDREAAVGKRVENFHRGPVVLNQHRSQWEEWLGSEEGANDRKAPPARSGTSTSSDSLPKKQRRTDLDKKYYEDIDASDDTIKWLVYGLGWDEAAADKIRFDNPYTMFKDQAADDAVWNPRLHEAYRTGFQDYFNSKKDMPPLSNPDKTTKARAVSKAKLAELQSKAAEQRARDADKKLSKSPVGALLDEKQAVTNVANISDLLVRKGPNGKKISKGKFEELTGHKCGWCETEFNPDKDNGKFVNLSVLRLNPGDTTAKNVVETTYVCGECLNDPVQHGYIQEATVNNA